MCPGFGLKSPGVALACSHTKLFTSNSPVTTPAMRRASKPHAMGGCGSTACHDRQKIWGAIAGRGTSDAFNFQSGYFEHPLKHAPRKGTVSTATLQGKIDRQRIVVLDRGLSVAAMLRDHCLHLIGLDPNTAEDEPPVACLLQGRPAPSLLDRHHHVKDV